MKLTMILLSFVLVFWNVENFFDPASAGHPQTWTNSRFRSKCNGIAKTVLALSDSTFSIPDIIALAEVENRRCLSALAYGTALQKFDYGIIHSDSPDERGIDCAILYRRCKLQLLHSHPRHLLDSSSAVIPTRDILVAEFLRQGGDSIAVLVNHHPSKRGGSTLAAKRREGALRTLKHLCDSLQAAGFRTVIAVGDFNDTASALSDSLLSPMVELQPTGEAKGSIKYNGGWELIDRALVSPSVLEDCGPSAAPSMTVFDAAFLTTRDSGFGGTKPLRTFSGPRYLGGISDHYPIVVTLF